MPSARCICMATSAARSKDRASDDEMLEDLRRVSEIVGGQPTPDDVDDHGRWSHATYYERWDNWAHACDEAGVSEQEHDVLRQIVEGNGGSVRTRDAEEVVNGIWHYDVAIDDLARECGYQVNEHHIVDPDEF